MTLTDWTDYNSRQTTPGYRPEYALKPCPFCGSVPAFQLIPAHEHYLVDLPAVSDTWVLECSGCPAGFVEHTQKAVADLWNRREP